MWKNTQNKEVTISTLTRVFTLAAVLCLFAGCATAPPKPPVVDGKSRVPVNNPDTAAALARRAGVSAISDTVVTIDFGVNSKFTARSDIRSKLFPNVISSSRVRIVSAYDAAVKPVISESEAYLRADQIRTYLLENGVDTEYVVVETPPHQGKIPAKTSIPVEVHIEHLVDAVYPKVNSNSWDIHGK